MAAKAVCYVTTCDVTSFPNFLYIWLVGLLQVCRMHAVEFCVLKEES
jgi:hypothetical protein